MKIKISELSTIVLRLYVALIVGMFIVNAAFGSDDEIAGDKE